MPAIKVLITDDSVVYRSQIKAALSALPEVEIVGAASNGRIAIDRLKQTQTDLLILDLEMPEMDGLQTLAEISKLGLTVKTLVFSSASKRGADITFEALRMGAKDFVTKPGSGSEGLLETTTGSVDPGVRIRSLLEPKLRALFPDRFGVTSNPKSASHSTKYPKIIWELVKPKIVVIGSSTGGPTALEKIFLLLKSPLETPVLIAQHMPPIFTASLAERIMRLSGIKAKEGRHGEIVERGCIYIAPGDYHMTLEGTASVATIKLDQNPLINSVRPSVDPLFTSAAQLYREGCLGLVLTGMGHDGKTGSQVIKENAGAVMIQDRESCVVYGMPGAVEESGAYDKIGSLEEIAHELMNKITSSPITNNLGEKRYA